MESSVQAFELRAFNSAINPAQKFGAGYDNALWAHIPNDITEINPSDEADAQVASFLVVGQEVVGVATDQFTMIATIYYNHGLNFDQLDSKVTYENQQFFLQDNNSNTATIQIENSYNQDAIEELAYPKLPNDPSDKDTTLDNDIKKRTRLDDGGGSKSRVTSCLTRRMMILIGIVTVATLALGLGAHKKGLLPFGKTTV